uniref:Uncharacterized protein n=1 Tax=Trichobilharzia regenti TaxID=157069 RepID=A0AA85JFQ8_TRIRE|nr:unnamed protein product [Trichobilharzia regenti]
MDTFRQCSCIYAHNVSLRSLFVFELAEFRKLFIRIFQINIPKYNLCNCEHHSSSQFLTAFCNLREECAENKSCNELMNVLK